MSKTYWSACKIQIGISLFFLFQIIVTFSIVFGVILYRISIKAALHMSTYPAARSNIRATVKTTAAIIYLIIIIILDEIYASIARWLTTLGRVAILTLNLSYAGVMNCVKWAFIRKGKIYRIEQFIPICTLQVTAT